MSYVKNEWKTGDLISEPLMNHIENGIVGVDELAQSAVDATIENASAIEGLNENKAAIDGFYEEMAVGAAEQLISNTTIENQESYNCRVTGGGIASGIRKTMESIYGGTIVWNQLNNNGTTSSQGWNNNDNNYFSATYNNDGSWTFYGTTPETKPVRKVINDGGYNIPLNHVLYATVGTILPQYEQYTIWLGTTQSGGHDQHLVNSGRSSGIIKTNAKKNWIWLRWNAGFIFPENGLTIYPQVFDLTLMFGETVANAILEMETISPGAGASWFERFFSKKVYSYNAGELMSVHTSEHRTIGFNAYNNTTGKAKVLKGHKYQITGTHGNITLEGETITPDDNGYFIPNITGELSVAGGNGSNTCVHLVMNGERDDEFEPYNAHSYPLDSSITLYGKPKWNNSYMYFDGDRYDSNGQVVRKYTIFNLGEETWTYYANGGYFRSYNKHPENEQYNIICTKYASGNVTKNDMCISISDTGRIQISDSTQVNPQTQQPDAGVLTSSLNGVYAIIGLKTTTTESAEPFTSIQVIDSFGTEEFIDAEDREIEVPVGHISLYQPDLRTKLESIPNKPSSDGDYIVRSTNGENVYVPLVIPNELPVAPTTDGTYKLVVTVTDGEPTYTWEAEQ